MRNLHKSLPLIAAGMLLGAVGAHGQGIFSNAVSRGADRSASRSAGGGSVSSAAAPAMAGGAASSGGGHAAGGRAGGVSSLSSAGLSSAKIASICGRQASNSRVASACSSAGYMPRPTRSSFAAPTSSAGAGAAAAASAGGMDANGSGFAADDLMGGSDALTGEDSMAGDSLSGDSMAGDLGTGEGDVPVGPSTRPTSHPHSSHGQPAAAARYAHAGQLGASDPHKRRSRPY